MLYYGYITDITKQKELYLELNATSNILDSIFNNSFNFIVLLDNKGKLIKANHTALKIVNFKEKDVIGKYFWQLPWWEYCTEEELDVLRDEINIVNKGACLKNDKYYYDINGQKIHIDFSYSPVLDDEKNVSYILVKDMISHKVFLQKKV